ncbi:MAG: histone deacetylase [bacterium]
MRTAFIYDSIYLEHENPPYHPESSKRLVAIVNAIENNKKLKESLKFLTPRRATKEEIIAVHDEHYYDMIMSSKQGYLDSDTYVSAGTPKAAVYAAGAVLTAVEAVKAGEVDAAFCAVRPPGHHAERDEGMGFCIFNNVAVGARYAINNGFQRAFIIDFDVHHGNGTEHIFYRSPDVFYFSTHQSPLYPGTGRKNDRGEGAGFGTNFNYPLPPDSGDEDFLKPYKELLPELISQFNPGIIFVSAGYDIRDRDPLASLNITKEGIKGVVEAIIGAAKKKPLIFTLEGGYNLDALAESVVITLECLVKL